MSTESAAPWGESAFESERRWFAHLPTDPTSLGITKEEYAHHRAEALRDPTYDLFEHCLPSGRPKADIGRYVMRYGINVPLITSLKAWQNALDEECGMLRSELRQDYNGYSGLLSSRVIEQRRTYPKDERDWEGVVCGIDETGQRIERQTIEGPVQAEIDLLPEGSWLNGHYGMRAIGSLAVCGQIHALLAKGLYDGTVNPTTLMQLLYWNEERLRYQENAQYSGFTPTNLEYAATSHWRYVPGVNIRVFRDPVIEGKYFIGGSAAHHHWEPTSGYSTSTLEAHDKSVYRGYTKPGIPEYTLPGGKIIALYEKIRTLPYFDHSQAPVMEFQYGTDSKLYFLQYLKTGLQLGDPGEFDLPSSRSSVTVHSVRGATTQEGETVRMYLDPRRLHPSMRDQGAELGLGGLYDHAAQVLASIIRVAAVYGLNFKDDHFSSAPLTRTPVVLGIWDEKGGLYERLRQIATPEFGPGRRQQPLRYINTLVTSNGRKATVDSDWVVREQETG